MNLNSKQLKIVLDVLRETLFAERQTIEAKISAMELICLLQIRQPKNKQIKVLLQEIDESSGIVFQAKEVFMEKGYSITNLKFIFALLQSLLKVDNNSISKLLISFQSEDMAVRINATRSIERLSEQGLLDECMDDVSALLFHHTLSDSNNSNPDLQFYAMSALSKMLTSEYRETCLDRFVEMMDYESYLIKVGMLYRLREDDINDSKIQYIFEKGKNDNHFWVRYVSNMLDSL